MIKFKAMFNKIEQVEVERETEKMVVVKDSHGQSRKESKITDFYSYWDTWDEAKIHLIEQAEHEVKKREVELLAAKNRLERINQLHQKIRGE